MSAQQGQSFGSTKFLLERWVQRGIVPQLMLMVSLVIAVAVLGGVAAWILTPNFPSVWTAIWWAFLRLTDPGYLGDDEGVTLRVVSTVVTVLGYVLFMGSLIAIMTQWLANTIRKLESGLTPISMENHFVILGWTNRTEEIVKKLLTAAGRLDRFLARRSGPSNLRIVILATEVDSQRRLELKSILGDAWSDRQVFLRSGSSLHQEHLARLDLMRASVIIVPGSDFELGGSELNDTRVVKTLLNLDALFQANPEGTAPCVVAELFDPRKITIARKSLKTRSEVIAGDRLVSRLLSQSLRHSGAGAVLVSLLAHREGNGLYLRAFEQFAGRSPRSLARSFPKALVLGFVAVDGNESTVHLNSQEDVPLGENDMLILVAQRYDDCDPVDSVQVEALEPASLTLPDESTPGVRRVLILGWSYKIPTLISELLESALGKFEVTLVSRTSEEDRDQALRHLEFGGRLSVVHIIGDYSIEQDLGKLEPHTFDHILFMASGWMNSPEEADARTVLGLLVLRSLLESSDRSPEILVELLDPENASLIEQTADVVFVSPRMLSHLLAHVGLLPELNAVFEDLICTGGAEVVLRPQQDLGVTGNAVTFGELQDRAARMGCTALGFYSSVGGNSRQQIELNPERDRERTLGPRDRVILLCTESDAH